jgi:hypothetical protein
MASFQIDMTTVPSEARTPPQLDSSCSVTPLVSNALRRLTRRTPLAFRRRAIAPPESFAAFSSALSQSATTCALPRPVALRRS